MIVRDAVAADWEEIARLIWSRAKGKVPEALAMRRARQMVSKAAKPRSPATCMVCTNDSGLDTLGFLFAVERPAFDLVNIPMIEIHYLMSRRGTTGAALALAKELRSRSHKRILLQEWAFFGRIGAMGRLMRELRPLEVARTYQL